MASFDEEIRLDEEENRRELAYIRTQLPLDIKKFYSDKDILYMMDLIVDYYYTSEEVFFIVQADLDFQEQNV